MSFYLISLFSFSHGSVTHTISPVPSSYSFSTEGFIGDITSQCSAHLVYWFFLSQSFYIKFSSLTLQAPKKVNRNTLILFSSSFWPGDAIGMLFSLCENQMCQKAQGFDWELWGISQTPVFCL